jgi:SMC interacting uncharacterized protein involved in chromosome segregation
LTDQEWAAREAEIELKEARSTIALLRSEMARLSSSRGLQDAIDEKTRQIGRLQGDVREKDREIARLKEENASLRPMSEQARSLQSQITTCRAEVAQLKGQLSAATSRGDGAEALAREHQAAAEALQAEVEAAKLAAATAQADLQRKVGDLESKLESTTAAAQASASAQAHGVTHAVEAAVRAVTSTLLYFVDSVGLDVHVACERAALFPAMLDLGAPTSLVRDAIMAHPAPHMVEERANYIMDRLASHGAPAEDEGGDDSDLEPGQV